MVKKKIHWKGWNFRRRLLIFIKFSFSFLGIGHLLLCWSISLATCQSHVVMEAGLSRALPARRAGVRLELCTHSRATPCLGNRLGQGAFVDWQDGGVQRLCQPIPLFSFQTWLTISFFLEASKPAPSQFSPFGPLCVHLTPGRSHCMCFLHWILFHFGFSDLTRT